MARENIDVTVDLHDKLSRPAGRAEEAVEDLGDEVAELRRELAAANVEQAVMAKRLRVLSVAARRTDRDLGRANKQVSALSVNSRAAGDGAGRLNANLKASRGGMFGFIKGAAMMTLKVSALTLVVTLAAAGVSALGAAGFAAVAGLSPLVGLLGGIPSLAVAAVSAFAAVKLGMSGIGDAVKAIAEGDPAKIREAMKGLTEEGKELARTVGRLADGAFQDLKDSTQAALAPGFTAGLRAVKPLLPIIETGLTKVAGTVGDLAERAGEAMATPLFSGQLARVMASSNRALSLGGRAAGFFGLAALGLADAFRPVQVAMSRSVLNVAEYIAGAVEAGRSTGRLTAFFERAWELAQDFGQVLADVSVALYNTGVASGVMSKMLGDGLMDNTARWRAWTETVEGQASLREWFADAVPVMEAFLGLIGDLSRAFANLSTRSELAPLLEMIRAELGPALSDLSTTVSNDLGPALVTATVAFVKFMTFLAGSPFADFMIIIANAAEAIASGLNALPGPMKLAILAFAALVTIMKIASLTVAGFKKAAAPMGPVFGPIAAGAREGGRGIGMFNRAAGAGLGAIGGFKKAGAGLATAMGGPWVIAIMAVVTAIGVLMGAEAKAKQRIEEFGNTLDEVTGAMTEATKEMFAQQLLDEGWDSKRLAEYGTTLSEVTDAMMAGGEEMEALQAKINEGTNLDFNWNLTWGESAIDGGNQLVGLMNTYTGEAGTAQTEQRELNAAMMKGADSALILKNALDPTVVAHEKLALAELNAGGEARRTSDLLRRQKEATDGVYEATLKLNGLLDEKSTWVSFRQTVLTATQALNKGKKTLDLTTQAGIDNWQSLNDIATAAAGVTGSAKKQDAAMKEARDKIFAWGLAAFGSKKKAEELVHQFIRVKDASNGIPKATDVGVTVNGVPEAISNLTAIKERVDSINAVRIPLPTFVTPSEARRRRDGGPVWAGGGWNVGEAGPELHVDASGVHVVGAAGPETRHFAGDGIILPNEFYEAARGDRPSAGRPAAAAAPSSSPNTAAAGSATDTLPVPDIHNHFHGDASGITPDDVEAASLRAWQKFERERRERR